MKYIIKVILVLMLFSCNQSSNKEKILQSRIDSLNSKLSEMYKPGFGEMMGIIQTHHAKLWFAGQFQNWQLADFEVHEIKDAVSNIQKFNAERPEAQNINMIHPVMDSIEKAIQQKNPILFNNSFVLLTNTCNSCHKATQYDFIQITVPAELPVVNQNFTPAR